MSEGDPLEEVEELKAYQRLVKKLTKENLWVWILRLLQDRDMYGYEIRDEIINRFDFSPAQVTCYVVLYKMEREKLVKTKKKASPLGRPDRKYYSITPAGENLMRKAFEFIEKLTKDVFSKTISEEE